MADTMKWTVSELLARYELEPQLADVFVEGTFDREILTNGTNKSGRLFYEIDNVEISSDILNKYGLTSGNKQRVIALSRELTALSGEAKVICLVDKDLDHWFGQLEISQRLRWTIYSSLELHFLTDSIINDILLTVARIKVNDIGALISSLIDILKTLYALRLADRQCGMCMTWVALRKYLSKDSKDVIKFDVEKYVIALLNSNGYLKKRDEFNEVFSGWYSSFTCDVRLCIRGHDFQALLAWAIHEFNGQKEFSSESAIERLFVFISKSVPSLNNELI